MGNLPKNTHSAATHSSISHTANSCKTDAKTIRKSDVLFRGSVLVMSFPYGGLQKTEPPGCISLLYFYMP